jgi:hypothetical protein
MRIQRRYIWRWEGTDERGESSELDSVYPSATHMLTGGSLLTKEARLGVRRRDAWLWQPRSATCLHLGMKVERKLSDFSAEKRKRNENMEIKIEICRTEMETEFL